jgi:hypothetical protein
MSVTPIVDTRSAIEETKAPGNAAAVLAAEARISSHASPGVR